MKRVGLVVLCVATSFAQPKYPATKTTNDGDTYFGKTYKDPYRWLEDTKNKDVDAWFKAQSNLADGFLDKLPGRDALVKEWTELDKRVPASYDNFNFEAGAIFYKKTLGGENVGKLYYRVGDKGAEKLLFDPGTYKAGVVTTINSLVASWDGKYVALDLTSGGSDYSEIRILDVAKARLVADTFYPSFGVYSWLPDSKSFLYDAGNTTDLKSTDIELDRHVRLHVVGTSFDKDRDMFSSAVNPDLDIAPKEIPQMSIDEAFPKYVLALPITVQKERRMFIAATSELKKPKIAWRVLAQPSDNLRGIVLDRDDVYSITHTGAPNYKVVKTSLAKPDWSKATTVIPEAADSIRYITRSKSYLFTVYSNGITDRITKLDFATKKTTELALPAQGTASVFCLDFKSNRCIVVSSGWISPMTLWDYDAQKDTFTKSVFNSDVTYPNFDQLVTEEVEVKGHDGTMIPLSIIHRKDMKLDGNNPTILEGYGAYGNSFRPYFDITRGSVALHGVVLAYPHVRGGGEKGEAWRKAGHKSTKPNTWKDFISSAEYLIAKGYTSKTKLAGTGTSAGGILISRAITERPDLFAAAVCNVCVANTLRAEFSPNGPVNTPEFGTVQNKDEIGPLAEMDGVSHVKAATKYPALLGVGGWNDPRVSVWQPGKLVAAVQASSTSGKPVLLKINYDNGHFTEEKVVTFKNFANQYGFMLWQTGHKEFQPK